MYYFKLLPCQGEEPFSANFTHTRLMYKDMLSEPGLCCSLPRFPIVDDLVYLMAFEPRE